jgi:modulator of FtsH protease HflK
MPWSSQNGGGGGWKGGGGGPWGQGPQGGQSPDLEELLKRSQDRLKQAMPGGGASGLFLVVLLFLGAALIGYLGFIVTVGTNDVGIVMRFGKYDDQRILTPGLNFRWPYPIESVIVRDITSRNRVEIGFQSGGVSSYGTSQPGRAEPAESLMLTGDENIIDINFVVVWRIKDAAEYLFNMEHPDTTVKAVAESSMREVVGKNKIEQLLTKNREETQREVLTLMQEVLDNKYKAGIKIDEVNLLQVSPPAQVNDAFRDVQTARADQERTQNEAQGYERDVVPKARGQAEQILQAAQGYRQQTVDEARGRTDRFLKIYEEYAKAPDVTRRRMYLETMERVLGNTDKVIIDEKGSSPGVVPFLPLSDIAKRPDSAAGGK